MELLVVLQMLIMIEVDDPGFPPLLVVCVYLVSMRSNGQMGVSLDTMLVLLAAVIVLRIKMRMRGHPLERHKGGKQNENESRVDTSLDHERIALKVFTVSLLSQHNGVDYTQPMKSASYRCCSEQV